MKFANIVFCIAGAYCVLIITPLYNPHLYADWLRLLLN
jgi:hypothetical protein